MQDHSELLKSLQHPMRLQIVTLLGEVPAGYSYTSLLEETGLNSTGKLNYHLKILEDLVEKTERGYILSEYGKSVLEWLRQLDESTPTLSAHERPSIAFDDIVPSNGLRRKYITIHAIVYIVLALFDLFFLFISPVAFLIALIITALLVWFSAWFALRWINTVRYTITDTEVRMQHGIIIKRFKVIPFRTITNLEVSADPFDRRYGIYSVIMETAGNSAQGMGPEGAFRGMVDGDEIRETILERVRLLNPPSFAIDSGSREKNQNLAKLTEILEEFRAINAELE